MVWPLPYLSVVMLAMARQPVPIRLVFLLVQLLQLAYLSLA